MLVAGAIAILAVVAPTAAADSQRLIVGFADPDPGLEDLQEIDGYPVISTAPGGVFAVVNAENPDEAARELSADPAVAYVEPDRLDTVDRYEPSDPAFDDQYGPQQVQAPFAWGYRLGGDRPVCVLDSGVRYTHQDLAGDRWLGGEDFVNDDPDPWDDYGHGTHVTGIAASGVDDGVGMAGIGNLPFLHMKVLDATGRGWHSDIASGLYACAEEPGELVITMSLGGSDSRTKRAAVEHAWEEGNLIVASAGNEGTEDSIADHYPAAYPEVIAVTCTTPNGYGCSFSSTGPEAELSAPGKDVLSTYHESDQDYQLLSGTSMSAPHVAAGAALLWSWFPDLGHSELRRQLTETARDRGEEGHDPEHGHGIVDVAAYAQPGPPATVDVDAAGPDRVTVTWSVPEDEGVAPVTGYRVYRGHAGDPWQRIGSVEASQRSFVDEGPHLRQPQQYRYAVQAINDAGPGALSDPACGGGATWTAAGVAEAARQPCELGDEEQLPASIRLTTDTAGGRDNHLAASGTGHASGERAATGTGTADGHRTAAGLTGDAACSRNDCSALSATGNAAGGGLAASMAGDADCRDPTCAAGSLTGNATGSIAVTATGTAEGSLLAASPAGETDRALVTVSGTDDSEGLVAVSAANDARGCIAVAGTGEAEAECSQAGHPTELSGCETVRDRAGTEAACHRARDDS